MKAWIYSGQILWKGGGKVMKINRETSFDPINNIRRQMIQIITGDNQFSSFRVVYNTLQHFNSTQHKFNTLTPVACKVLLNVFRHCF